MGPCKARAWEGILHINEDVEIAFIIFPDAVMGWAIRADEFRLQYERLELGITQRETNGVTSDNCGFFGVKLRVLGMGEEASLNIDCFADVEEGVPCPILVDPASSGGILNTFDALPD